MFLTPPDFDFSLFDPTISNMSNIDHQDVPARALCILSKFEVLLHKIRGPKSNLGGDPTGSTNAPNRIGNHF